MKKFFPFYLLLLLITTGRQEAQAQRLDPGGPASENTLKPQPDLGKYNQAMQARGLRFTENKGQVTDLDGKPRPDVLFTAQNDGVKLFLTAQGIHYQFKREFVKQQVADGKMQLPAGKTMQEIEKTEFYRLDLGLKGANPRPVVQTEGAGQDVENFFLAHAPEGIEGVRNFSKIIYKEVYPNIDWVVYTKNGGLEYDFVVRPGGKVSDIQLGYDGEQTLALQKNGALQVTTPLGSITENKPYSYQEAGKEVVSRFVVGEDGFGFDVPAYDKRETLTIDPTVQWATYYGGSGGENIKAISTDATGNVYVMGRTQSTSSIASGGHQNSYGGGDWDVYLVKFDAAGVRQWATYYGGETYDEAHSVTTDASGNVFISGDTQSTIGIASGGHQNSFSGGNEDAFLVKFNSSGVRQWGTYYGGSLLDFGTDVITDASGNVFLSGWTQSSSGIASGGHQNTRAGGFDAFLVKFNAAGVRQWATYYGGSVDESSSSVATDGSGNIYLSGTTQSMSGIASGGHQNSYVGGRDAFLVKFNTAGVRQWGTYYGGSGLDVDESVAIDASDNVYLAGYTNSTDGISSGGHQNAFAGGTTDAFLVKFNSSGVRQWSTYYGGDNYDNANSIAINLDGFVFLAGETGSTSGITSGGHQNNFAGGLRDAFLVKFSTTGERQWGSYYGGSDHDNGTSVATNAEGYVFLSGNTESTSGIAFNGFQNSYAGNGDGFLVKFSDLEFPPIITNFSPNMGAVGTSVIITGANFTGTTVVSFNNINVTEFTVNSATSITATLPVGASTGKVRVSTADGTGISTGDFTVSLLTTITSFNPTSGNVGTLVNITGSNFTGTINVSFNNVNAVSFTVNSATSITATVPVGATTGKVRVTTGEGTAVSATDFTVNVAPTTWYRDRDNDGFGNPNLPLVSVSQPAGYVAIGGDCNDRDNTIYPGAPELGDGIDNDCDNEVDEGLACRQLWYRDVDGDGYGRPNNPRWSCVQPAGFVLILGDCNDNDPNFNIGAPELADGKDNDCDGIIDEDLDCQVIWYQDGDGDGFGRSSNSRYSCLQPVGYVSIVGDCNDLDATIYPGATEVVDGKDNDCNGIVDDVFVISLWYLDKDGDGYGNPDITLETDVQPDGYVSNGDDCNDNNASINPGAAEMGDGIDNNCDGQVDEGLPCRKLWYKDFDGDGYGRPNNAIWSCVQPLNHVLILGDCNDLDPNFNIGAPELPDGLDNNCNGLIDEGTDLDYCRVTWYRDNDGDGYGRANSTILSCVKPDGFVNNRNDCNDGDPTIFLGAPELPDGKDNDCDGQVDEGLVCLVTWYQDKDGDGRGRKNRAKKSCIQPVGYVSNANDCNDEDATIYLGAPELCDGKDNDCDGLKDEGCSPLITGSQNQTSGPTILAAQKVAPEKISANAFPNPHNGSFLLEVQSPVAGKSAIVLYDLQGRAIVQRQEQLQVGTNKVRFDAVQKMTFMYKVTIGAHSVAGKVLSVQ